ncbi:MAG: ABC transporter ATP-binding protein [Actinomycetota bacterium]|nr:ABC transporter ATP-binding protein [Actinomycetota bacterium]
MGGLGQRSFLWRLGPYFRQVAGLLAVGSAAGVAMNVAIVLPAVLLGRAVNVALAAQQHRATAAQVGLAGLVFVAGTAATELPRIAKRYYLGAARNRFAASVRADALRGVLAWPAGRLARIPVGDVMARVIGDVDVLRTGVGEIMVETWDTLLFSASIIVTMFGYAPALAAVALAPVPAALWLARLSGRAVARRTTSARESEAVLTSVLREQIGALRLLRLVGRSGPATGLIRRHAGAQARTELAAIRLDEALSAVYTVVLSAGTVVIIWLGGETVAAGSMSVGALVAFLALFGRFAARAPRIPQMANRVQAAGAAYRRLEPLLADPLPVSGEPRWSSFRTAVVPGGQASGGPAVDGQGGDGQGGGSVSRPGGPAGGSVSRPAGPAGLRLNQVSFAYPGSPVPAVADLTLDIPPGALVAVTGPVGSGKSALARLAAGLFPPDAGTVQVDGRPAAALAPEDRAGIVGYLAQDARVFSGTIAENISFWARSESGGEAGPAASPMVSTAAAGPMVSTAAELAALGPDLAAMAAGTATQIGELGIRVSGGQRQRIALARAIAAAGAPPGLLVLDDPFSAVDVHTEAAIVAGLRDAFGPGAPAHRRATILLLSHRLAAFPLADLVVVLDAGRVREQGTHAALMAAGGRYARIARAQARIGALDDASAPAASGPAASGPAASGPAASGPAASGPAAGSAAAVRADR